MIRPVLNPEVERLARARYVAVTAYPTDGLAVTAPIRITTEGGYLLGLLRSDSELADRLRRDPRVALAPCDLGGNLLGDPAEGVGAVLDDPALVSRAQVLIVRKYGLFASLLQRWYRWRGTAQSVAAIEVHGD